jgi:hypothetical protein
VSSKTTKTPAKARRTAPPPSPKPTAPVPGAGLPAEPFTVQIAKPVLGPTSAPLPVGTRAAGRKSTASPAAAARAPRVAKSAKPAAVTSTPPPPATDDTATPPMAESAAAAPPSQVEPVAAVAPADTAPATAAAVTDDDIRLRAYFLSLEHRGAGATDLDFWLLAERELREGGKPEE